MKKINKFSLAAAMMLLTTACTGMQNSLSVTHAQAAKTNFDAMVGDATPLDGNPAPDARVIDGAIDRYQTDNVKQPRAVEAVSTGE